MGRKGEELAQAYLEEKGFKVIERNFRCAMGEVDLIAKDRDTIVFVEIKMRSKGGLGMAKEAVDERKQRQISKVALYYLKQRGLLGKRARFDVVAVFKEEEQFSFELVKNAFELKGL